MSFYLVMSPDVILSGGEDAALGLPGQAGMAAVRVADLASPAPRGLGRDGRSALTTARAGQIRSGDLVVWLKPVAVTRAVVRRDGRVQAAGHPADQARLGVAEERLDELCGWRATRLPGLNACGRKATEARTTYCTSPGSGQNWGTISWLAIFGREVVDVCVKFHAARGRRARVA